MLEIPARSFERILGVLFTEFEIWEITDTLWAVLVYWEGITLDMEGKGTEDAAPPATAQRYGEIALRLALKTYRHQGNYIPNATECLEHFPDSVDDLWNCYRALCVK